MRPNDFENHIEIENKWNTLAFTATQVSSIKSIKHSISTVPKFKCDFRFFWLLYVEQSRIEAETNAHMTVSFRYRVSLHAVILEYLNVKE